MATVPFPEVKDRNVATPSRVRIKKPVGIEDDEVFDVEAEPGTVYEEGTPLNKEFFDALKRYIDASSGAGEILGIAYGGTGADNAADARTNLEVYSKAEVDEELDRTAGLIEPHITRRVTDSTDGVHGFYIDQDYTMWIDPDGDGVFEEMPSQIGAGGWGWSVDDSGNVSYNVNMISVVGVWNTHTFQDITFNSIPYVSVTVNNVGLDFYTVKLKNVTETDFQYFVQNESAVTSGEQVLINIVAIG